MDIELKSVDRGVLLPLKVMPGSKQDSFRGVHDGALKISVTAVAEKGKANKAVIAFLAKKLKLPKSQFEIQTGLTDARKTVLILEINKGDLTQLLIIASSLA